jgi:16S rRNA C967 or C1407 C5-methylase (RsmB/RsmF family)
MHEYVGDVLDACAAPGGKVTFIAQILHERGWLVFANDLVLYRLKALVGHVARMRLENVVVTWSDARKLKDRLKRRFKRVLLDAPCSGEGRIMVDPERRTRTSILDLAILVKREIELLYSLSDMLEPGGTLVYVTCSIAPEENEYVVSKVLSLRGDLEVVEPPVRLFDYSKGLTSLF